MKKLASFLILMLAAGCGGGTFPSKPSDLGKDALAADVAAEVADGTIVTVDGVEPDALDEVSELPGEVVGTDVPQGDAAEVVVPVCSEVPPYEPGCPCTAGEECTDGYCLWTFQGQRCAKSCSSGSGCENGQVCSMVATYPDATFMCLDPYPNRCRPCMNDAECKVDYMQLQPRCAPVGIEGTGTFCLDPCEKGTDCPDGYACSELDFDGTAQKVCYPEDKECRCSPLAIEQGAATTCILQNTLGACQGTRTCGAEGLGLCLGDMAVDEVCDSLDNDCDGSTDEDIASETCILEGTGHCEGVTACIGGQSVCTGSVAKDENCNGIDDDCDGQTDEGFPDTDTDGTADCMDDDDDGDTVPDATDNCPLVANLDQLDTNGDAEGDACDMDDDGDGLIDTADNCPVVANKDQADADGDGTGNACDCDQDDDGVLNDATGCEAPRSPDNCPLTGNPDQADTDGDGLGDACDDDLDGDGIANGKDNCPGTPNPGQEDLNKDGVGDACADDIDGDHVPNATDNCPVVANPDQTDLDGDKIGDACDCDLDGDGAANANAGCPVPAKPDVCPLVADPAQLDFDGDGVGDACDPDIDNDKDPNETDCGPADALVHHGAIEECNGKDDNCNGLTDEGPALGCILFYLDADGDSYGKFGAGACRCLPDGQYTAQEAGDCNDTVATIHPGATELCNKADDDCDTIVDEENAQGCTTYYYDGDGDGHGGTQSRCLCTSVNPWSSIQSDDCDDADGTAYPGAAEACDGADDDCDGSTDEGEAKGCQKWFMDADRDGYGTEYDSRCRCTAEGYYSTLLKGDCDDNNSAVFPGGVESCNGKDDDCDGSVDEGAADNCTVYYKDADGDGHGKAGQSICRCNPEAPYTSTVADDCNDSDPNVFGGTNETCNGKDDDCDGQIDEEGAYACTTWYYDGDGDGHGGKVSKCLCKASPPYVSSSNDDCDDTDGAAYPGAPEVCNERDDDCDGQFDEGEAAGCLRWYLDTDNDGFGVEAQSLCRCKAEGAYDVLLAGDCDDGNADVKPTAREACNGKDDDCNGQTDEGSATGCTTFFKDADGDFHGKSNDSICACVPKAPYTSLVGDDCNDQDPTIGAGNPEVCNGVDDDCDALTDEEDATGCAVLYYDGDNDGHGTSANKKCLCLPIAPYTTNIADDCNDANAKAYPGATEACDGIDNDCNLAVDEGAAQGCTNWFLDADGDGYGNPNDKRCRCTKEGQYNTTNGTDCNDNDIAIRPGATESCNGKDDDCDGSIDEGAATGCTVFYKDADGDGHGKASDSSCLCEKAAPYTSSLPDDCDDTSATIFAGAPETCNGKDDDCDGLVDEAGATGCVIYWSDKDGDGYGTTSQCLCAAAAPYTAPVGGDCNDGSGTISPKAVEACNGVDDDCDGALDEENATGCSPFYTDADADGYGTGTAKCLCLGQGAYTAPVAGDCDDTHKTVYPSAPETCDNLDNDCDGSTDELGAVGCTVYYYDGDVDTYGDDTKATRCTCKADTAGKYTAVRGLDCNDANAAIAPGKTETCNGLDDNCTGTTDEGFPDLDKDGKMDCVDTDDDNDGDPDATDCQPLNAAVFHGATDVCNLIDDNCSGATDENNGACATGNICFKGACRAKPVGYCTIEVWATTGNLYAFCSSGLISWYSADSICKQWGGGATHVTINSNAELDYIRGKVGTAITWLGYHDDGTEGTWKWDQASTFLPTPAANNAYHWCSGEPNNMTNEDCAEMNWNATNGCWNDCECDLFTSDCTPTKFVCEMPK